MNTFIEKSAAVLPKVRFLDIYMMGHKGYVAGGCFKNIFQGERLKDIDLFFESEKDWVGADLYYKTNEDYVFSYENNKVKAYKNKKTEIRVELVRGSYGTAKEMLERFDFSVVKFAYYKKVVSGSDPFEDDSTEYVCLFHIDYFEHLVCKKLVIEQDILFPESTWERSYRYVKYGFRLCFESKKNLMASLKDSDPENLSNSMYDGID